MHPLWCGIPRSPTRTATPEQGTSPLLLMRGEEGAGTVILRRTHAQIQLLVYHQPRRPARSEQQRRTHQMNQAKEILAAVLLGIVVAFWTWQFVEHLAK